MTTELDVAVDTSAIAFDVAVSLGPVLVDVAVDTAPIVIVVGQASIQIDVPADSLIWQDYAPSLFAGVAVPVSALTWIDYAPEFGGGETIDVPADELTWADFAPIVSTGARVAVPADILAWADFAPSLFAAVTVPADAWTWTDFAPAVGPLVNVVVPSDALVWSDFAPSVFASVAVPTDGLTWTDYAPSVGADVFVPTDLWTWTDYIPVGNYGFSGGFGDGFSSAPSDPPDTEVEVPADGGLVWAEYAPSVFTGVAVPSQALAWADFAPDVEVNEGYSFTMTAGDFASVGAGYGDGVNVSAAGDIDAEPLPGHNLAMFFTTPDGGGQIAFAGDATVLLAGLVVNVGGVAYPFDDEGDWTYGGFGDFTAAGWSSSAPNLEIAGVYACAIK